MMATSLFITIQNCRWMPGSAVNVKYLTPTYLPTTFGAVSYGTIRHPLVGSASGADTTYL
jgi:hypothetical protein